MENFTLSWSSSSSSTSPPSSSHIAGAAFDDYSEDFCSICLEPFGINDPSTITSCKHEYHLHCILEWSERSRECPICLQLLSFIDPSSQELLAAVEAEKCSRSRNIYPSSLTSSHIPHEQLNYDYGDSYSDESDIDDQIMQHLVAASSRSRFLHRRERQRSSSAGPSEVFVSNPPVHVPAVRPILTISPTGSSSPTSGVPSTVHIQPPTSAFPPVVGEVAGITTAENDVPFKPRVLYTQSPSESGRRLNTPEMFSIPESFRSKFSAASARYKESITKSTRGLKEKLIAHNASVKELSKGVQREMNAGIAGVARMIERLDLSSKRSNFPPTPVGTGGSSGSPVKGKSVDEDDIDTGRSPSIYTENVVQNVSSDAPSVPGMVVGRVVAGRVEIHHCVQSGKDAAVRT
ncbi:hypothetical protein HN51_064950 [Arachis hypogaea]|uniref:RING-type E3 ubiquitin transferase n=1 Tax=Arachis hypogaea TaxID=3818 RepID=A0A444ZCI2_ARAHY|nr:E3 ubiquitin-protein ligase RHF1A [Arachis ipaensis]XP_025645845.1 E3 ubiquitin-protein ligase RHF1A [Arachis hypogaea]QHO06002.1 E3 ubiquitin-protein ligase RHF1A [Arachis hypogaea]RYR11895.1 hypothetical protein Ahy_B04g069411 [Arachis hypogaea]